MNELTLNDRMLRFKSLRGFQRYNLPTSPEYIERRDYELGVIADCHFATYFLIVWDLCAFMQKEQILYNVRGSACGSVVVWSLGISNVFLDPIRLKLPFERFLNPERVSNPDMDIDIDDTKRQEVFDYTVQKYGADKVARIITHNSLGPRSVIQDVCRSMHLSLGGKEASQKIASDITRYVPVARSTLKEALEDRDELQEYQRLYPKVFEYALQLEGTVRNAGVHPAGVVVAPDTIEKYLPLYWTKHPDSRSKAEQVPTTQWDMYDVESRGLLKLDYLGLKTLRVIGNTVKEVNKVRAGYPGVKPFSLHVYSNDAFDEITYDDEATWALLASGELGGIFQIEAQWVAAYAKRMRFERKEFWAIPVLMSIIRPGMVDAGTHEQFLKRVNGEEESTPPHPLLADTLKSTQGLLCFQEDVMLACRDMSGMTLAQADEVRRGVAKKKPEVLAKMKPMFVNGALKKDVTKEDIESVWELMEKHGRYSFNKCIAADQHIERTSDRDVGCNHASTVPTVHEMYMTMHDLDWAKANNRRVLHFKYQREGYGYGLSISEDGRVRKNKIVDIIFSGYQECFRAMTSLGHCIEVTADHRFPTPQGELMLSDLSIGDVLYVRCDYEPSESGDRRGGGYRVVIDRIVKITSVGIKRTYSVEMAAPNHTFCINHIVTSNSHAAAYGLVTYWTAYLKAHFPLCYMTHLISSETGGSSKELGYNWKVAEYVREAQHMTIKGQRVKVLPPCVMKSDSLCTMDWKDCSIRFGLSMIKDLSKSAVAWILAHRSEFNNFKDMVLHSFSYHELQVTAKNPETGKMELKENTFTWRCHSEISIKDFECLILSGATDSLPLTDKYASREDKMDRIKCLIKYCKRYHTQLMKVKNKQKVTLQPDYARDQIVDLTEEKFKSRNLNFTPAIERALERQYTGCYLGGDNPFLRFAQVIEDRADGISLAKLQEGKFFGPMWVPGIVAMFRVHTIKKEGSQFKGQEMAFITVECQDGMLDVVCFPSVWAKTKANPKTVLQQGEIYMFNIKATGENQAAQMLDSVRLSGTQYEKELV